MTEESNVLPSGLSYKGNSKLSKEATEFVKADMILGICENKSRTKVVKEVMAKYAIGYPFALILYDEANKQRLETMKLASKEDYLKEGIIKLTNLEEVSNGIIESSLEDGNHVAANMAVKNTREILKDKHEILGIGKGEVSVDVNVNIVNVSEDDVLNILNGK